MVEEDEVGECGEGKVGEKCGVGGGRRKCGEIGSRRKMWCRRK